MLALRTCIGIALTALGATTGMASAKPSWWDDLRSGAYSEPKFTHSVMATRAAHFRCSEEGDSLSIDEAKERVKWARRCNVADPDLLFQMLYIFDTQAMKMKALDRPWYPLFLDLSRESDPMKAPIWKPNLDSCSVPSGVKWGTTCRASCYAGSERLWTAAGDVPIKLATEAGLGPIVTLSPRATLGALSFRYSPVGTYVQSFRPALQKMVALEMADGRVLKVTTNHPIVTGEGVLVEAGTLEAGQTLLDRTGEVVAIDNVRRYTFFGKVYNVEPESFDPQTNVVVVEGFLNGSARWQGMYAASFHRLQLRRTLPAQYVGGQ